MFTITLRMVQFVAVLSRFPRCIIRPLFRKLCCDASSNKCYRQTGSPAGRLIAGEDDCQFMHFMPSCVHFLTFVTLRRAPAWHVILKQPQKIIYLWVSEVSVIRRTPWERSEVWWKDFIFDVFIFLSHLVFLCVFFPYYLHQIHYNMCAH